MNNHADMQKQLSAYCGGDLEPEERVRLEEHLAGCASCRAELADLRAALRLIRTTPESEPPPWLAARIMARVREEQRTKRSWRQRLLFPLYIKLPIEAVVLLLVCVSGYYLARDVETGMKQPAIQQELPTAPPESGRPAGAPGQEAPPAAPPVSAPPPPTMKRELRPEEEMPPRPPASKAADQAAPRHVPEPQGKPSPQPAFAPAPPVMKEDSGVPAAESAPAESRSPRPGLSLPAAESALPADGEMRAKAFRKGGRDMEEFGAARDASGIAPAITPQVRVRMQMSAPASAPGSIREAITRSGGSVIDDGLTRPNTIKARIPAARLAELLERLGRLGRVVEQPRPVDKAGMVEIEIVW